MKRQSSGNSGNNQMAPSATGMSRESEKIVVALNDQNILLKEQNSLLMKIVSNTSK
jgi:hypothetical protein